MEIQFRPVGPSFVTKFQLTTFQGVRPALFNFNTSGVNPAAMLTLIIMSSKRTPEPGALSVKSR